MDQLAFLTLALRLHRLLAPDMHCSPRPMSFASVVLHRPRPRDETLKLNTELSYLAACWLEAAQPCEPFQLPGIVFDLLSSNLCWCMLRLSEGMPNTITELPITRTAPKQIWTRMCLCEMPLSLIRLFADALYSARAELNVTMAKGWPEGQDFVFFMMPLGLISSSGLWRLLSSAG